MTPREWSPYQTAFFDAVAKLPSGAALALEARAGSGKTTTACEAARRALARNSGSVLAVAFGKQNAEDLGAKMPAGVETRTMHSLGNGAVSKAFNRPKIEKKKYEALAVEVVGDNTFNSRGYRGAIVRVADLARNTLSCFASEISQLVNRFQIDGVPEDEGARRKFIADVLELLERGRSQTNVIDFTDMIWFPIVHDLSLFKPAWVIVDEAQDLNACQTALVSKLIGSQTRLLLIGDPRQAIYTFRGATDGAFEYLVKTFSAKVLPLPVCYRCDSSIVELARETVPDLQARPGAPSGVVRDATYAECAEGAEPGDYVISRTRAPMLGLALELLSQGKPAVIVGRDIVSGLTALVKRSKATTIVSLRTWLDNFVRKEFVRLAEDSEAFEDVADSVAALKAVAAPMRPESHTAHLIAGIEGLFADSDESNTNRFIRISTTHKAKGLEADRVWLLADTYLKRETKEESNLFYVGTTRAKHELVLCRKEQEQP